MHADVHVLGINDGVACIQRAIGPRTKLKSSAEDSGESGTDMIEFSLKVRCPLFEPDQNGTYERERARGRGMAMHGCNCATRHFGVMRSVSTKD